MHHQALTLELLLLPSCFWRGLGFLSPCLELLLLSALKDILCRVAFGFPGSLDFSRTPKDPTVLQEVQFQSNTLYFKPFFSLSFFSFFNAFSGTKCWSLESASTFLQAFFPPILCLQAELQSWPLHQSDPSWGCSPGCRGKIREFLPYSFHLLHHFDFSHTTDRRINLSPCTFFCREAKAVSCLYWVSHKTVVLKQQQWEEEDKTREGSVRY